MRLISQLTISSSFVTYIRIGTEKHDINYEMDLVFNETNYDYSCDLFFINDAYTNGTLYVRFFYNNKEHILEYELGNKYKSKYNLIIESHDGDISITDNI